MSGDYCAVKEVVVTVQENGIIRSPDGYIIGRLNEGIDFDSTHLRTSATTLPLYYNTEMIGEEKGQMQ